MLSFLAGVGQLSLLAKLCPGLALANSAEHIVLQPLSSAGIAYAAVAASITAHCSESRDPFHLLKKLRLRRQLRRALHDLST